MSKPVSFSPKNRPTKALSVAISARSSVAFSTAVQRDFISALSTMVDIKNDVLSFQKNYYKKMFYLRVSTVAGHNALISKGSFMLDGTEWNITPASSVYLNLTAHWAPDEMADETILEALRPYGECLGVTKPKFTDPELSHVRTGIRVYRFKCHQTRYVPNFVNFGGDVVMFTYPGQAYECRKCGQTNHKAPQCKATWCDNCNGFSPHENPHIEKDCKQLCRMCASDRHTVMDCCARAWSYAARVIGDRSKLAPTIADSSHLRIEPGDEDTEVNVCEDADTSIEVDTHSDGNLSDKCDDDGMEEDYDKELELALAECEGSPQEECGNPPPEGNRSVSVGGRKNETQVHAEVHKSASPGPAKQKRAKLENRTPDRRQRISAAVPTDSELSDDSCMTPTPTENCSTMLIDYRKKKTTASRGRRRLSVD